jgi:hypothetical protein
MPSIHQRFPVISPIQSSLISETFISHTMKNDFCSNTCSGNFIFKRHPKSSTAVAVMFSSFMKRRIDSGAMPIIENLNLERIFFSLAKGTKSDSSSTTSLFGVTSFFSTNFKASRTRFGLSPLYPTILMAGYNNNAFPAATNVLLHIHFLSKK